MGFEQGVFFFFLPIKVSPCLFAQAPMPTAALPPPSPPPDRQAYQRLRQFFDVWELVEQMHPWGVDCLEPFLSTFDIPASLCAEVDARLYVDLMITPHPDIRRIKLEGRGSGVVCWAVVELDPHGGGDDGRDDDSDDAEPPDPGTAPAVHRRRIVVSFQRSPAAPLVCRVSIAATPRAVVACLAAYHRGLMLLRHAQRRPVAPATGAGAFVGRRRCRAAAVAAVAGRRA